MSGKERKRVGASNENVGGALAAIVGIAGAQPRGDCLRQHVRMVASFDAAAGGAARRAHANKAANLWNPFDILANGVVNVVRHSDGDDDLVAGCSQGLIFENEAGPGGVERQIGRRPEAPAAGALLDLDRLAGLHVEERAYPEGQRDMRIEHQAEVLVRARCPQDEFAELGQDAPFPIRRVADVATVEMRHEIERLVATLRGCRWDA
jgi:hypothetical protein